MSEAAWRGEKLHHLMLIRDHIGKVIAVPCSAARHELLQEEFLRLYQTIQVIPAQM